jgi:hypothetical protein
MKRLLIALLAALLPLCAPLAVPVAAQLSTPAYIAGYHAQAPWSQGINFRKTVAFVQDLPGYFAEIGSGATANFPETTPQGSQVGFIIGNNNSQEVYENFDEQATNDPRLAGINYAATGTVYVVTLPAPGQYNISLAVGDLYYTRANQTVQVYDGPNLLGTLFANATTGAAGLYLDATGTAYTATNWPINNKPVTLTFTTTQARFVSGTGAAQTLATIFIQAVGPTPPVVTPGSPTGTSKPGQYLVNSAGTVAGAAPPTNGTNGTNGLQGNPGAAGAAGVAVSPTYGTPTTLACTWPSSQYDDFWIYTCPSTGIWNEAPAGSPMATVVLPAVRRP